MILEYSRDSVDRMHVEGAVFHSVNKNSRVTSVDFNMDGVAINGKQIDISVDNGVITVDFSNHPEPDSIARYMKEVWNGRRIFPNCYAEDMPADEYEPTQVERFIPTDVEHFYDVYEEWVNRCVDATLEKNVESGFYQDSLDNIMGITTGELGKLTWPVSIIQRHGMRFHTHPQITFTADPSVADLELLDEATGSVAADAVASTFDVRDIYTISYTAKVEDGSVDPDEEVRKYISEMKDLVEEELAIGKMLIDEGKLDMDKEVFGKSINQMAKNRVDKKEKRDMIRQIALKGYRIEPSWAVVQ
jgi:hypothetical protein